MWEISRRKKLAPVSNLSSDKKVKTIAIELADHKLFAKLSEGDMVATEAVYHLKCLNELSINIGVFATPVSGKMKAISLKLHVTIF